MIQQILRVALCGWESAARQAKVDGEIDTHLHLVVVEMVTIVSVNRAYDC